MTTGTKWQSGQVCSLRCSTWPRGRVSGRTPRAGSTGLRATARWRREARRNAPSATPGARTRASATRSRTSSTPSPPGGRAPPSRRAPSTRLSPSPSISNRYYHHAHRLIKVYSQAKPANPSQSVRKVERDNLCCTAERTMSLLLEDSPDLFAPLCCSPYA